MSVLTPLFRLGGYAYSLYSLFLLFTAIAAGTLSVQLVRREKGSEISWWAFAPMAILTAWLFTRVMSGAASAVAVAEAWTRAEYLLLPFLPAALAQFAYVAVGQHRKPLAFLITNWTIAAVLAFSVQANSLIVAGVLHSPWGFYPRYGTLGWTFILFFTLVGAASLFVLVRGIRRLPDCRQRRRLTQFAIAYATGFIGLFDFLPAYGFPLVPFAPVAALCIVVLVARAIRKYELFDITPAFAAENIVSTIPDALVVTDDEGLIRIANEAACTLTGYTRDELLGMPLQRVLVRAEEGDGELQPREGAAVPVSIALSPLMDGARRVGAVIVAHDLREQLRLRTEAVRRKAEAEYRTLVESMSDGIVHFDANDVVRYINERAESLLDVKREDVIGGDLVDLLIGSAREERHEVAVERSDGTTRWIEVARSPVLDERGALAGTLCILEDVTERRRAQQMITASAREWRETFDAIQMPLAIIDANGIVQRANRAAIERTGLVELWAKIDQLARTASGSQRVQFVDGAGSTWDLALDVVGFAEHRRVIVAGRDISAIVQLQQSLRRSETMAALGALVGGVAHEVRNPLFAMSSTLDAFSDVYGAREEYRAFTSIMSTQLNRVNTLMSDLLELGRPAPTDLTPHSLSALVGEALALCADEARKARVTIVCESGADDDLVAMNDRRLAQAISNLVRNAVQFSPRAGVVTVHTQRVERAPAGPTIVCTVADHGAGFRPGDLRQVFEPFFTRRKGGTGLGLAIARAIVEQHHGSIFAANQPDGGAIVTIELPAAEPPSAAAAHLLEERHQLR